jgi:multiple antibiotic resistance protein
LSAQLTIAEFVKSYIVVLATTLAILNPASTAPIFLSLTRGAAKQTRNMLARRISINVFYLMTASMLIGSFVLDFFGISLPIVRVGGGLIVATYGWRLLHSKTNPDPTPAPDDVSGFTIEQGLLRQSFFPLTFPVSCGPGSMATAITLGVNLHSQKLVPALQLAGAGVAAIATTGVAMFVAFRYAEHLLRPLGEAGTDIFLRLSAFVMVCLGVQIMWDGASELIRTQI